ncbi:annexin [Kipferlia bialata]|uniref:Annexin n=1 Tax=Kipferlia bialata TaxID=797122 RepID=A0A9K3D899_9EUKA|nr:annexin [Kipferlia bialata]|eukprot:g12946.t1
MEPTPELIAAADALYNAISGGGTDDETVISTLATHTNPQIQAIRRSYEARYARDLIDDIKGDTTGKYEDLLVAVVTERHRQEAMYIRKACKVCI